MPSGGVTEGVYDFSYRRTVMDRGKDENYFGVTKRSGYSYAMHTSATTSAQMWQRCAMRSLLCIYKSYFNLESRHYWSLDLKIWHQQYARVFKKKMFFLRFSLICFSSIIASTGQQLVVREWAVNKCNADLLSPITLYVGMYIVWKIVHLSLPLFDKATERQQTHTHTHTRSCWVYW